MYLFGRRKLGSETEDDFSEDVFLYRSVTSALTTKGGPNSLRVDDELSPSEVSGY